ncbi:type II secretion system protein GspK [Luteimonas sp. RD2P54]|uniref:Type II secretion system protein K n=1 Tax=Luteimonas endophytica TaxID=3042023 RepID=A0ABT6J6B0_9GAMM|nr:type II secretion system protein GspK [Luteimonas endophytica]MDH5822354.1 type II secretion system protein GspK [Luteimonas endophytica]
MTAARPRGAALLLVLWLVALLTALVGGFALTARVEHMQGRVLHRGVAGTEAARAGLEYAVARLADQDLATRWLPDGREYAWTFADAQLRVRVVDETGKVDLNAADQPLLAALLRVAGAEPGQAGALAGAILDWRDPDDLGQPQGAAEDPQYAAAGLPYGAKDAPFESVGELELVLGMTAELVAVLREHVTVHSGQARPDQRYAGAEVLEAMGLDAGPLLEQRRMAPAMELAAELGGGGSGTYSIDSRARLPDGRDAVLQAVVRAGGNGLPGAAYTPLRWKEGTSAPDG